jgi:peroxiredoxin
MDTYYSLLGISTEATTEEIETAYQRQCEWYSTERVADLDDEFRRITEARTADFREAYAVLRDPQRRRDYDVSLGIRPAVIRSPSRARLSRREIGGVVGGALVGIIVIAVVWLLAGRTAQPALPPVAELRRPAPVFALPGLDGTTIRLDDYRGKVVLINFWGTWCEPCKDETPALQEAYRKLHDQGLVIIGIDLRGQERGGTDGVTDVRAFVDRYGVTYPIALDVSGDTARAFQIYPIPTSYFIDQTGMIRYVRVSALTAQEVEALFTRLQQEAAALR